MNINLEIYSSYKTGKKNTAKTVTFCNNGLSITKAFHERIGSPKAVILAFDPENKVFGIRKADASEKDALPVKYASTNTRYTPVVDDTGLLSKAASIIPFDYKNENLVMSDYECRYGFICFDMLKAVVVKKMQA